jgi:hypothetical protein
VECRAEGMANTFGSPRDTHAELQRSETWAEVVALMHCAQCGEAQPGFPDGDGARDAPHRFAGRQAVAVSELWHML